MNIIVKPLGSDLCYCRPDTTWERENKDFYVPECIDVLRWTPIVFVRICKAGKCIGERFASRYYDAFNFGALIYCIGKESGERAFTSCADHSSLLPAPLYNPVVMENEDNEYEVMKDGHAIFGSKEENLEGGKLKGLVEEAICHASQLISLRIGDFIAVELSSPALLASRDEKEASLKARYCGNSLYDMKIIF